MYQQAFVDEHSGVDPEFSQGGLFSSNFPGTHPLLTKLHPFFYCSMSKRGSSFEPKDLPESATDIMCSDTLTNEQGHT